MHVCLAYGHQQCGEGCSGPGRGGAKREKWRTSLVVSAIKTFEEQCPFRNMFQGQNVYMDDYKV